MYQRFARTLEEAFGPYTSKDFHDLGPTWQEWAIVIGFALFAITVLGVLGWYFLG